MTEQAGEKAQTPQDPARAPLAAEDAAGDAGLAQEAASDPVAALAAAEARAAENWNQYLRAVAEMENLRKRLLREADNARRAGIEKLAGEILPVADSLEMALGTGEAASVEALLEGKAATLRLLQAALERTGIEVIDPQGEAFDPQLHEAMSMQPAGEAAPGSVLAVLQKGYKLNDRLLRPARVVVAGEPETT